MNVSSTYGIMLENKFSPYIKLNLAYTFVIILSKLTNIKKFQNSRIIRLFQIYVNYYQYKLNFLQKKFFLYL